MSTAFLYGNDGGGGGAALNFKVVGYATKEELLAATPAENTIGIITTTEISGWAMGDYPHPCWEMSEGFLYINVKSSSYGSADLDFAVLKRGNEICIAPISAKQYISGAWVERTAKSYQNGAWVDWLCYIFKSGSGDEVDLLLTHEQNSTVTMTNEKITIVMPTQSYGLFCVTTEEAIDCSKYKRLVCELKCTKQHNDSAYQGRLTLDTSRKGTGKSNNATASVTLSADSTRKNYEIDLSGLNGSYYIALRGGASAEVYNWYLE